MTAMRFVTQIVSKLAQAWRLIWFDPAPTTPLEIARIGLGVALLELATRAEGPDGLQPLRNSVMASRAALEIVSFS